MPVDEEVVVYLYKRRNLNIDRTVRNAIAAGGAGDPGRGVDDIGSLENNLILLFCEGLETVKSLRVVFYMVDFFHAGQSGDETVQTSHEPKRP